ncbi:hypothetical protein DR999_PMT19718 [Platysternon megacephalum]|uniref:Uncharacterized protein n=1 Tax=Platysternon megacephalum TaxID=55544 RepID=A0A4D9DPP4_9SAUR|nr:hypothetical protein DR999_PMT19718 [Platysternon megacephalum]
MELGQPVGLDSSMLGAGVSGCTHAPKGSRAGPSPGGQRRGPSPGGQRRGPSPGGPSPSSETNRKRWWEMGQVLESPRKVPGPGRGLAMRRENRLSHWTGSSRGWRLEGPFPKAGGSPPQSLGPQAPSPPETPSRAPHARPPRDRAATASSGQEPGRAISRSAPGLLITPPLPPSTRVSFPRRAGRQCPPPCSCPCSSGASAALRGGGAGPRGLAGGGGSPHTGRPHCAGASLWPGRPPPAQPSPAGRRAREGPGLCPPSPEPGALPQAPPPPSRVRSAPPGPARHGAQCPLRSAPAGGARARAGHCARDAKARRGSGAPGSVQSPAPSGDPPACPERSGGPGPALTMTQQWPGSHVSLRDEVSGAVTQRQLGKGQRDKQRPAQPPHHSCY